MSTMDAALFITLQRLLSCLMLAYSKTAGQRRDTQNPLEAGELERTSERSDKPDVLQRLGFGSQLELWTFLQ